MKVVSSQSKIGTGLRLSMKQRTDASHTTATAGKSTAVKHSIMNSDVKTIRHREVNKKQSNYIKKIQMQLIDVQTMLHNINTNSPSET